MTKGMRLDLDRLGAVASAICAVHCLLTGVALGLLSVMGLGFLGSETTELAFLSTAFVVGALAMAHGVRKHHSALPATFFATGLVCWLVSHFVFHHGHRGEPASFGGTAFAILGGLCLVTFHVLNQRLAHRCGCRRVAAGE